MAPSAQPRTRRGQIPTPAPGGPVCRRSVLPLEAMLILEVDGSQHGPARDAQRTAVLEAEGFMVLRFWNNDVLESLESVLLRIEEVLTQPGTARR